jgi:hypothetical protein
MPLPTWLGNFISFGWIRDLLSIRKDIIDTKKSKLEVRKLEAEERERNLITRATFEDVKRYDPKVRQLFKRNSLTLLLQEAQFREEEFGVPPWLVPLLSIVIPAVLGLLALIFTVLLNLFK